MRERERERERERGSGFVIEKKAEDELVHQSEFPSTGKTGTDLQLHSNPEYRRPHGRTVASTGPSALLKGPY